MRNARWASIASGLVLALASPTSNAQDLPRHVFAVSPDEEIQDLLFLGDARPVLIRLHIRVDGEGHRGRWREFVRRLHAEADADRDGTVTRLEANNAIDLVSQMQSGTAFVGQLPAPRRRPLVAPQIVTVDYMLDQMWTVAKPFQIGRSAPASPSTDEATFRLIDRDGDGHLSREELAATASSLARLDLDDDETITAEELGPYRSPPLNIGAGGRTPIGVNANPTDGGALISASELHPRDLARMILKRYDARPTPAIPARPSATNPGGRVIAFDPAHYEALHAGELQIDREAFDRIDSNFDGSIYADELERAVTDAADLELIVRLGRREPGQATIERLEGPAGSPPFGAPGFRRVGDLILIDLPTTTIELRAEADGADPFAATRANLDARFDSADIDRNGILDKTEVRKVANFSTIFAQADRDGDGNLTRDEWRVYRDRREEIFGLRTVLQASEQGPSFLDLLDDNRDRKLGLRELQGAARKILLEDRDGDDRVSLREFARHHRWTVARGQASTAVQQPFQADQRPARPGNTAAAPEWFLKMDRNRDGDLSPREFLGTRSTFEEYDTDRDGLIAPREANRRP